MLSMFILSELSTIKTWLPYKHDTYKKNKAKIISNEKVSLVYVFERLSFMKTINESLNLIEG